MQHYNAIFIIGTGRSGTHHLCKSLLDFSNINDTRSGKENSAVLHSIACNAIINQRLKKSIINYYKQKIKFINLHNQIFLDQSHSNLYHYSQLNAEFKNSLFLGIDRPTEQIVASMFNHNGTSRWYDRLRNSYPMGIEYPNKFFGLTDKTELNSLPKHLLFAKRVIAHKKIYKKLLSNSNFRLINFENFISDKLEELEKTFSNNELSLFGSFVETEFSNKSSLFKYKQVLSKEQIKDIKKLEENEISCSLVDEKRK